MKNILVATLIFIAMIYMFMATEKRDQVSNDRFDSCLKEFKNQGMPQETYEGFMRPCMDK